MRAVGGKIILVFLLSKGIPFGSNFFASRRTKLPQTPVKIRLFSSLSALKVSAMTACSRRARDIKVPEICIHTIAYMEAQAGRPRKATKALRAAIAGECTVDIMKHDMRPVAFRRRDARVPMATPLAQNMQTSLLYLRRGYIDTFTAVSSYCLTLFS